MTVSTRIDGPWAPPALDRPPAPARFCSRCGELGDPAGAAPGRLAPRVCGRCGLGVMLGCEGADPPAPAAPFAIVTGELTVAAVSLAGEKLLGKEDDLIGTDLADLLSSPLGVEVLLRHTEQAALRRRDPVVVPVRIALPGRLEVGTLAARVSTCGPPRAALLTLEQTGFGRR